MRRRTRRPGLAVQHRWRTGELTAWRRDLVFTVGVLTDALRGRAVDS